MARPNRLEFSRRRFLALLGLAPAIAAVPQAGPETRLIWVYQRTVRYYMEIDAMRARGVLVTLDPVASRPVTQA